MHSSHLVSGVPLYMQQIKKCDFSATQILNKVQPFKNSLCFMCLWQRADRFMHSLQHKLIFVTSTLCCFEFASACVHVFFSFHWFPQMTLWTFWHLLSKLSSTDLHDDKFVPNCFYCINNKSLCPDFPRLHSRKLKLLGNCQKPEGWVVKMNSIIKAS